MVGSPRAWLIQIGYGGGYFCLDEGFDFIIFFFGSTAIMEEQHWLLLLLLVLGLENQISWCRCWERCRLCRSKFVYIIFISRIKTSKFVRFHYFSPTKHFFFVYLCSRIKISIFFTFIFSTKQNYFFLFTYVQFFFFLSHLNIVVVMKNIYCPSLILTYIDLYKFFCIHRFWPSHHNCFLFDFDWFLHIKLLMAITFFEFSFYIKRPDLSFFSTITTTCNYFRALETNVAIESINQVAGWIFHSILKLEFFGR